MYKLVCSLILGMSLFVSGCATLADAKASKGSGEFKVYEKSYDVVWDAVIETVNQSNLEIVTEDRERGLVLAQGAVSAFSWGENVAIFVESVDGKIRTRVEVVNKLAVSTNITAPDWEGRILMDLDSKLN